MKLTKRYIVVAIALMLWPVLNSDAQTAVQYNSWWMYFGNHQISEKLSIHSEYQWRRSDFAENWQQSLMRVGLDYHFSEGRMFTAGYGWIESFPYGEQPIAATFTEHRIWQQGVFKQNFAKFNVHHRYRLEQRFLEQPTTSNTEGSSDPEYKFKQRGRYRFMVSVPLGPKNDQGGYFFVSAYDEVFLGFGKGIKANVLEQNRLYFALGWQIKSNVNVQLGYLNQFVLKGDGLHKENNHTLQTSLTYNIDFRKAQAEN